MSVGAMLLLQAAQQAYDPQAVPVSNTWFFFTTAIKLVVVMTVLLVAVALLTLMERKVAAFIQDRPGPNRVGPWGLLQPAAEPSGAARARRARSCGTPRARERRLGRGEPLGVRDRPPAQP